MPPIPVCMCVCAYACLPQSHQHTQKPKCESHSCATLALIALSAAHSVQVQTFSFSSPCLGARAILVPFQLIVLQWFAHHIAWVTVGCCSEVADRREHSQDEAFQKEERDCSMCPFPGCMSHCSVALPYALGKRPHEAWWKEEPLYHPLPL